MKTLEVSGIKKGTVIDHIPADKVFLVVRLLGLETLQEKVFLGTYLGSKRDGTKGIVKIANKVLTANETNKIALIASGATVNIIENYEVVEKRHISLPSKVVGLVRCFNPKCITNKDPVTTVMHIIGKEPVALRCQYCERVMGMEDVDMI